MAHQIGFVGLGKMGTNIVLHLTEQGIEVVAYNRTPKDTGFPTVKTPEELVKKLSAPRVIFLMVTAAAVDEVIGQLPLSSGDILIDGGNSFYKDTVRRAEALKKQGITLLDCGVSGGLDGARKGASLMLGGEEQSVTGLSWLWDALAVKGGWGRVGPSGAGHFVKMVHNGIEYGMDQAVGEGIDIITKSPYHIDLLKLVSLWNNGSIIRSYIVELLGHALAQDPTLAGFSGKVGGGETGGWTLAAAREFGVDAPVLEQALAAREKSKTTPTTASKVVSALRRQYGGHDEAK